MIITVVACIVMCAVLFVVLAIRRPRKHAPRRLLGCFHEWSCSPFAYHICSQHQAKNGFECITGTYTATCVLCLKSTNNVRHDWFPVGEIRAALTGAQP